MSALQFLLLEPNISDAEAVNAVLQASDIDCNVLRVDSYANFVQALETNTYDIILSDYALSDRDGISTLEIARKLQLETPFIFVSNSIGEELAIAALEAGAAGFVLKHRLEKLIPCVQRALKATQASRQQHQKIARLEAQTSHLALFESIDEGFCICQMLFDDNGEPEDYRFIKVNSLFEELTGLEQPTGKTARELVPNLEAHWFEIYGKVVKTGEPIQFEEHSIAMNRWFNVHAFRMGEPQNHQFAILFTNISDRKLAEAATRQSEARLHAVASNLPYGAIFIVDRNLRYLLAEGQALEDAGMASKSLVGKTLWEALDPALANSYAPYYRQALKGEPFGLEHSSHDRYYVSYGTPLYNENGEIYAVLSVSYDISDRKKVEQERERFLTVASDLQAITSSNGYFQWVSPTFEQMLGWTNNEMLSRPWADFVHPDDISQSLIEFESLLSGNETLAFENRYQHKNGSYRWLLWKAQPHLKERVIYGTAVDISDRKLAEASLHQSESRFRLMVESAKDYAIFTLDLDGIITSWNSGAENLLGYAEAEIIGCNGCIIFTPEDREQGQDKREQEIALTQGRAENERWHVRKDGSYFWGSGLMMPLQDEAGIRQGFIKIMQDKTAQRQTQAQREQLLQREQAARAAAEYADRVKNEFLAVLSHELRSPLNPILGWAKLLQKGTLSPNRQAEALKTIERNATLQSQLIEDLLDISRIMQGKLSLNVVPIKLKFVISAAAETVRLAAEAKSISILLALDDVSLVLGDAARLQQVVWNLLTNAVKFTPKGGQVTVELRQIEQLAQIQVIDTGKGIQPQFLPYVFEYFRQEDGSTTRKFGGLGLGLAIVRQIVEMHGGTVKAESLGENRGATFTVQLPIVQQAAAAVELSRAKAGNAANPLSNVQILVVDDDADSREFQAFLLEQNGARVITASSGLEALQAIERAVFDVLVSDVGMAQMDGYMLMQQIRLRSPDRGGEVKAIAVTAYARDFDRQQALQAGFQAHISKPIDPEELVKAIVNLLEVR
ncbi:PAS domain S-box protein [Aliterella atlantica]|uniref:PAS domain S-box protein n=1 Tax=Aliterella atlantica TaxID=1827278 RepID=UPI0006982FAA|nr:PAS domain S-box protein [Aliterella atlantica]